MSVGVRAFVCAGVGEDDLRTCIWWYGGEMLSLDIWIVLDRVEGVIVAVSPS